jgi:hypothetical protein
MRIRKLLARRLARSRLRGLTSATPCPARARTTARSVLRYDRVHSPPEVTVAPTERACHVAVADTFCVAPSEKVAKAVSCTKAGHLRAGKQYGRPDVLRRFGFCSMRTFVAASQDCWRARRRDCHGDVLVGRHVGSVGKGRQTSRKALTRGGQEHGNERNGHANHRMRRF